MFLTNEPGYYKTNQYGIRIENVLLVVKRKQFLSFEILSINSFNSLSSFINISKVNLIVFSSPEGSALSKVFDLVLLSE